MMEIQITKRIPFLEITDPDTGEAWWIPRADFSTASWAGMNVTASVTKYGVRLSLPGYLDCTDWDVFDTIAEAESHAAELEAEA
jgi:hypothetical protein